MAVAYFKTFPLVTGSIFELAPSRVLWSPVEWVMVKSVLLPMNVLASALPAPLLPAFAPKNELPFPVVTLPASSPKYELLAPAVLSNPEDDPKNELPAPVVGLPASTRANRLFVPGRVKTRTPPRLNCVVAFRMFAPNVPATFNEPGTWTVSAFLPGTTVLLVLTTAPEPIAVAKLRPSAPTLVKLPTRVLFAPVLLFRPVSRPKKELPAPVSLKSPALCPKNELSGPELVRNPAACPKKELLSPLFLLPEFIPKKELLVPNVFVCPAACPKNEFSPPVVLCAPASSPKKELTSPVVLLNPA